MSRFATVDEIADELYGVGITSRILEQFHTPFEAVDQKRDFGEREFFTKYQWAQVNPATKRLHPSSVYLWEGSKRPVEEVLAMVNSGPAELTWYEEHYRLPDTDEKWSQAAIAFGFNVDREALYKLQIHYLLPYFARFKMDHKNLLAKDYSLFEMALDHVYEAAEARIAKMPSKAPDGNHGPLFWRRQALDRFVRRCNEAAKIQLNGRDFDINANDVAGRWRRFFANEPFPNPPPSRLGVPEKPIDITGDGWQDKNTKEMWWEEYHRISRAESEQRCIEYEQSVEDELRKGKELRESR